MAELEKHKAEAARQAQGREAELAAAKAAKESALLEAQKKALEVEKKEMEAQLIRQRAENERLALLETERKKAEQEKAELEAQLKAQHEKEVMTWHGHHTRREDSAAAGPATRLDMCVGADRLIRSSMPLSLSLCHWRSLCVQLARLEEDHIRKMLESQLAADRERAKREADLAADKLKAEERVNALTKAQHEAQSASAAGSDAIKK
jgi:hypothetical protein